MTSADIAQIIELAKSATGAGTDKWDANTALISWFRSQPVEVAAALYYAARCVEMPGGLNTTRLVDALNKLVGNKKASG